MSTAPAGQRMILEILYYETKRTGGGWVNIAELPDFDRRELQFPGITIVIDWSLVDLDADIAALERNLAIERDGSYIQLAYDIELLVQELHAQLAYDNAIAF